MISFHQVDKTLLRFDNQGNLKESHQTDLTEAHGITLVKEGDTEHLWVADNGKKRLAENGYEYPGGDIQVVGQVVKMTLDAEPLTKLATPPLEIYDKGDYSPTWVAVNEERHGGNGDVWVADGYGQSHVHRYTAGGDYMSSINGEEGSAGAFNQPHAIFIDRRKSEPELYVGDRSNDRVQVYDTEGRFKRAFGSDFLVTPTGFVTHGETMVIAELRARMAVVDIDDNLVTYLGANQDVAEFDGWPNNLDDQGSPMRTKLLEDGRFNSPHGMTVDADGNIYVAEWLIGGRYIKLKRKE